MKLNKFMVIVIAACTITHISAKNMTAGMPGRVKINPNDVRTIVYANENGNEQYSANLADYSIVTAKRNANGSMVCTIQKPNSSAIEACDDRNFDLLKRTYAIKQKQIKAEENKINKDIAKGFENVVSPLNPSGW